MIKVAIVGNIASGKSVSSDIIKELGYKVFDTDEIAHKILYNSKEIIEEFKDYNVLENNIISRKKLGDLVFSNTKLKKKLETIIHPKVKEEINNIFIQNKNEKYIFIAIPLLFEANMQNLFDKIIFIYCDDNIRLERLMTRNNLSKEDAKIRINSQISQNLKIKQSDYIIKNETTIDYLKSELTKIIKQ